MIISSMEALRIRGKTAVICRLTFQPKRGVPPSGINFDEWIADCVRLYEHAPAMVFVYGEPSLTTKFIISRGILSRFRLVGQYKEAEGGYRILKDDDRVFRPRLILTDDDLYRIAKETN